jgi:hypothetical protein
MKTFFSNLRAHKNARRATSGISRRRLSLELLESRVNPAVSLIAVGADAGSEPQVTLFDEQSGVVVREFLAYDAAFTGGVKVAVGDIDADGSHDVVTAAGAGGGPHIKVFDGNTGELLLEFFAFQAEFTGGVNVAVADFNADGRADIVAGAGAGGGPHVRVFDGVSGAEIHSFFAYQAEFSGGVNVAAADLSGDGIADIVTAPAMGGGPHVKAFDGVDLALLHSFYAYDPNFGGGVFVAAADLTADGYAEIVTGAGIGGGPHVRMFDGQTTEILHEFFAYDAAFTGGVRVAAVSLDSAGEAAILTAPGAGSAAEIRAFIGADAAPVILPDAFGDLSAGVSIAHGGLPEGLVTLASGTLGDFFASDVATGEVVVTLQLDPLNINLLGLQVQTSPITVTVSVETGSGQLLGNLLTVVSNLINLEGVNAALNNVLDSVVGLVNSATLEIDAAIGSGSLSTAEPSTTPILDLFVAPVQANLLGVRVDTSPIIVSIVANAGDGLILGNVLTELAHIFDPPLPEDLELADINSAIEDLLTALDEQIPGIPSAPVDPVVIDSNSEVLRLVVPPLDVNLLGLNLQTDQIKVNADAETGPGELLGNVVTTLLNSLGASPQEREDLSNNLNALLARVVGILNATNLVLPEGAIEALSPVLQQLALPTLVTPTVPATSPVLDVEIAAPDGPPVDLDLLGLRVTTSDIRVRLDATTGDGQVLGNLVYNVSHLLDPGGSLNLLTILAQLAL